MDKHQDINELLKYTTGGPVDPTAYNRKKQEEAMEARKQEIVVAVSKLEKEAIQLPNVLPITEAMNWIEKAVKACGGEQKVTYLDVTHTFIKVFTRVPMQANLFQFLPEAEDNPRFHKTMTKLLLQMPFVTGVRWIPNEQGAALLVDIKGN